MTTSAHVVNMTTARDRQRLLYCPVVTNILYSSGNSTGAIPIICVSDISRVNSEIPFFTLTTQSQAVNNILAIYDTDLPVSTLILP